MSVTPLQKALDLVDDGAAKEILGLLLAKVLEPSLSAPSKKDFELYLLEACIEIGFVPNEPTEYDLISRLKVTRSKALSLIYERELRRRNEDDLDRMLVFALRSPRFHKQGDVIALDIDNPLLRDHLKAKLKILGHASDGSFSPSLVRISRTAFGALIESALTDKQKAVVQKALVESGIDSDTSIKGMIKSALGHVGRKVMGDVAEDLAGSVINYVEVLFTGSAKDIQGLYKAVVTKNQRSA